MTRRRKAKSVRFNDRRRTAAQRKGDPAAISLARPDCPHPLKRAFTTKEEALDQLPPKNRPYRCRCGQWHTTREIPTKREK